MEKTFISTQKYLLTSPRKIREVVALIKKLKPTDAIAKLDFVRSGSAGLIAKVIKTAIAQAKVAGVGETDLAFKEIQIGQGPRLKRGRAASRGRWALYAKRMSHIRVILVSKQKVEKKAEEKKVEVKNDEKKGENK